MRGAACAWVLLSSSTCCIQLALLASRSDAILPLALNMVREISSVCDRDGAGTARLAGWRAAVRTCRASQVAFVGPPRAKGVQASAPPRSAQWLPVENAEAGSVSNTNMEAVPEVAEAEVVEAEVVFGTTEPPVREGVVPRFAASSEDTDWSNSTCRIMRLDGRAPHSSVLPRDSCHAVVRSLVLCGDSGAGTCELSAPRARFFAPQALSLTVTADVFIEIGNIAYPLSDLRSRRCRLWR